MFCSISSFTEILLASRFVCASNSQWNHISLSSKLPVQRFSFKDPTVDNFYIKKKVKAKIQGQFFSVFLQCRNDFKLQINKWIFQEVIWTWTATLEIFLVALIFAFCCTYVERKDFLFCFCLLLQAVRHYFRQFDISLDWCIACSEYM